MFGYRAIFCKSIFLSWLSILVQGTTTEVFNEQLIVTPLTDGKISATFAFSMLRYGSSPSEDDMQNYTVFPLALGQILREYAVSELHLTLNAGMWNYDRWGIPSELGIGTGAELWAWMGDGAKTSVDHRWIGLRNALAGLFCASLGALDEQRTSSPSVIFQPEGDLPFDALQHQLRHASLPSENVCTENLTPFLKLLPCKSLSGIASLLNPHRLFDADWHGMGVHVLWHRGKGVEIRLTFQSIIDPLRSSQSQAWSLRSLFDRTIDRKCPVAQSSRVAVTLPHNSKYTIEPEPSAVNSGTATYDVLSLMTPLNISLQLADEFKHGNEIQLPGLSIQRTLRGSSQARGQLSVVLHNRTPATQRVVYLETMPWIIQFYLHTLETWVNGTIRDNMLSDILYIPAVSHGRPSTLQSVIHIPPSSILRLTMDVTKAFLRYTEHPPDAQRGWDLPPAVFKSVEVDADADTSGGEITYSGRVGPRMYTPALLVDLATPDFSMPYNVIIFTCSVVALFFGFVFNILTREFVVVVLDAPKVN